MITPLSDHSVVVHVSTQCVSGFGVLRERIRECQTLRAHERTPASKSPAKMAPATNPVHERADRESFPADGLGGNSAAKLSIAESVQSHGAVGAAVRAVFLKDGNVSAFIDYIQEAISGRDAALVAAATKSRLRIHDNACELLDSRDMLSETASTLDTAAASAVAASSEVERAKCELARCVTARRNLDDALEVIARTRSLVRVYARAEDMVSARRLHAALQTLARLDSESAAVSDKDVLREVVPRSLPLRSEIIVHVRRALHTWLNSVRSDLPVVGAFALSRAFNEVERRKATSSNEQSLGDVSISAQLRWIPQVREDDIGIGGASSRKAASVSPPAHGSTVRSGHSYGNEVTSPVILSGPSKLTESSLSSSGTQTPTVSMRSLLTCVLACRDLDRMSELSTDYERERAGQLEAGIDRISSLGKTKGAKLHSQIAAFAAGFFVVERAVESYTGASLMDPESLDQLWSYSKERIAQLRQAIETTENDAVAIERMDKTDAEIACFERIYCVSR